MGEHGFYDKRAAFEPSIRIPMLVWAPGLIKPGTRVEPLVKNIDIAPTVLDVMRVESKRCAPRYSLTSKHVAV